MSLKQMWSRISTVRSKHSRSLSDLIAPDGEESIVRPYRTLTKRLLFPAFFKEDGMSNSSWCLLYPESRLKTVWDLAAGVCISCQAMIIPIFLAFEPISTDWLFLDLAMLAFFAADIFLSFNLAFYELGALVTDRKRIAINYLRGWCLLDVLATFPLDMVVRGDFVSGNGISVFISVKLFRFTKVLRLLRIVKLRDIVFMLEDVSSSQLIASCFLFIRLVFILTIMAHWFACAWIFVGNFNEMTENWLMASDLTDSSYSVIYVTALYWALTTITSAGYGDVRPTNLTETYYVLFSMVISSVIFAYLLGSITAFIIQRSASESLHRENVMSLCHFMKSKQLSAPLRGKVKRYLEFVWELTRNSPLEKAVILPLLSKPLRNEIFARTRGMVFNSCPIFDQLFSKLITTLSELLKQQIFAPEDVVFLEGEMSSTLYFIQGGTVDVYHLNTKSSYRRLNGQDYFGEVAFFSKMPRTASVRCLCFTELFSLERCVMDDVCSESPEALVNLNLVHKSLEEGNLTCLGLKCYICSKPGHVAIYCKSVLIINDKDKVAKDWADKRNKKSVYVNSHQSFRRNFSRKSRYIKPHAFRSLIKSPVSKRISEFIKTTLVDELPTPKPETRPRYTYILEEEDSDFEPEEYVEREQNSVQTRSYNKPTVIHRKQAIWSEGLAYCPRSRSNSTSSSLWH